MRVRLAGMAGVALLAAAMSTRLLARPTGTGGTCRRRPFAAAAADEPALSETTNVHEHPGSSRPL
jgi:hypothetical protein